MRAFFLVLFLPTVAFAQGAGDSAFPTSVLGWIVLVATLIIGAAVPILTGIAPRTKTTVDDDILAWLKANRGTLDDWLNPSSPAVPPTPLNPTGREQA